MMDLFKLILGVMASLFKSRAKLEAEILILGNRSTCFAGGHRNDGTSTIPIVFCLVGCITGSQARSSPERRSRTAIRLKFLADTAAQSPQPER